MTKRPAFQFYPGDWMKDPALALCTLRARGLLIELMCVMHESSTYGALVAHDGRALTKEQILRVARASVAEGAMEALDELIANGVIKHEHERNYYYSARMMRDEEIRQKKARAGSLGGKTTQA